ncbi:MAG: glycosyltransferase family 39 protein [Anaerolineales bacterium]
MKHRLALVSLLLAAFALRTVRLRTRPVWYDEAGTFLLADAGLEGILAGTVGAGTAAAEEHPVLYHALLWAWLQLLGASAFAARLLSVFSGLIVVGLAYRLAREVLRAERAATAGAAFLALAPFQIHYAQELRMYALLAMWLLAATWAYVRAVRGSGMRGWVVFGLLAALAQYTHTLASLYLVPLALTAVLLRRRRVIRNTVLAGLLALLLYVPWLFVLPRQLTKIGQGFWIGRPGASEFVRTLLVFTYNLPLPGGMAGLGLGLFVGLVAALVSVRAVLGAARSGSSAGRGALWLLYLGLAPFGLMFIVSQWFPVYVERALLASSGMYLLGLAGGLFGAALPRLPATITVAALGIVATAGTFTYFTYAGFPYAPYDRLAEYLASDAVAGTVTVHSNKLTFLPTHFYNPANRQAFVADAPGSGDDTFAPETQAVIGVRESDSVKDAVGDAERVLFVIFEDRARAEYATAGAGEPPQLAWLDAHFQRRSATAFGEVAVLEYVRP